MSYVDVAEIEHFVNNSILYKGYRQSSLKSLRDSQDHELTSKIVRLSSQYLYFRNLNKLKGPNFFAGSVDFIIRSREGKKKFHIIEARGPSRSNFSSLPKTYWQMANDSILESLLFTKSKKPLVMIAHPAEDRLYYEKYCLAQNLWQTFLSKGFDKCCLIGTEEVSRKENLKYPTIVLGSYDDILPKLTASRDRIYFDNNPIDILVGSEVLSHLKETSTRSLFIDSKTVTVNPISNITDDRFLTYKAADSISDQLSTFEVEPIRWGVGYDFNDTIKTVESALKESESIIISPHGDQSFYGTASIVKTDDVRAKLQMSLRTFKKHDSFMAGPYPYTISKMIDKIPVSRHGDELPFDIRVFIGRSGSRILPLGAVLQLEDGTLDGGEAQTDGSLPKISRLTGLNKESLKLIGLMEMDLADNFSAGAHLVSYMGNNLNEIVSSIER